MDSFRRNENMDCIKGIAIIFVIIGHGISFFNLNDDALYAWRIAENIIYSFHMPVFFIVSGYLAARKDYKIVKIGAFIKKSLLSLYIPYLVLVLFWLLEKAFGMFVIKVDTVPFNFNMVNIVKRLWDGPGTSWFLIALLLVRISYCMVMRYGNLVIATVFYSFFSLIPQYVYPDFPVIAYFISYFRWGVFYCIGSWIYTWGLISIEKTTRNIATGGGGLLLVLIGICYSGIDFSRVDFISKLFIGTGITYMLMQINWTKFGALKKIFRYYGFYSMDTYMIHSVLGMLISRMLAWILGEWYFIHILLYTLITLEVIWLTIKAYMNISCFQWIGRIISPYRKNGD